MHLLLQPVTQLKGVGNQLALKLEKLGLISLQDLLFHLPYRYQDRTRITAIGRIQPFQQYVMEGCIEATEVAYGRRRSLVCRVKDDSGVISLRFFYFSASQQRALAPGQIIRCFGEARPGASGLEIYHPEYQQIGKQHPAPLETTLTPSYHSTEGLTQPRLRKLIEQAFSLAIKAPYEVNDLLVGKHSETLLERLKYLHFPPQDAPLDQLLEGKHPYQQALIMEELTACQLSLLRLRQQRQQQRAPVLTEAPELIEQFIEKLPFALTNAQQRVCSELRSDMTKGIPMMRLLQGDVGSGKTLVAAISTLQAVASEKQAALMAPTDILAEQHRVSFETWFQPLGIKVGWLTGKQKSSERRSNLDAIADGSAQVIIGTHALFQNDVQFDDLALVIIDEQHRFGVHQRLQLTRKGSLSGEGKTDETVNNDQLPHQLVMTATPIPRTLAMSAYADLDYSVIDEMPKGRIPVETAVISHLRRQQIIDRIDHACQAGRQAYWVCTLIEQSESLSAEAAEQTLIKLQQQLPHLAIGLIHGRLKPREKEQVMGDFKSGEIQLLVATTVIEVGVDIANASLMVIENPERLGLAQLHQLRGRIGRGNTTSHCVLLYGDNLSANGKARLQAMRNNNNGFRIAELDLELRGPGEVLGTRQAGDIQFKLANLQRDLALLQKAKRIAQDLVVNHPEKVEPLIKRWVGNSEQFAQA